MLNRLQGVYVARETQFVPDLYEADVDCLVNWPDARVETLIKKIESYLVLGRWINMPTLAGFRDFTIKQFGDYANLIRYVWQLEDDAQIQSLRYLGDNTPRYIMAIPLLNRLFPTAVYIHVVRDGRDVVSSVRSKRFGPNSTLLAARTWMDHIGCWNLAEKTIPSARRLEIRYEDLVSDPETSRNKLSQFLNCVPDSEPAHLAQDSHGLSGVAHHNRLGQPIDSSSVGRFRKELTAKQIAAAESVMYPGLVAYGYSVGEFTASALLMEQNVLLTGSHLLDLAHRVVRKVQPCP